ncbi:hypothetical protein GTO27_10525, partial [Candidatus Bathyarchaeota archaeon]|nr:hypothetical protein [Candidatus Bathyarchaeota archaeon]
MVISGLKYPHEGYRKVLTGLSGYFTEYAGVYAVVLIGSLARGRAVEGSCIDVCIFLHKEQFDSLSSTIQSRKEAYSDLKGKILYHNGQLEGGVIFDDVRVDLVFTDGSFKAYIENSFDITRDEFETTIGNLFVYGVPLYEEGGRYQQLRRRYLPYYPEDLRKARLEGTAEEFRFKIWKARWLAERDQFFAALDALLEAKRIFLQHLFIKERKYPIDYTKWLKEQLLQILKKPSLYEELVMCVEEIELRKRSLCEKSK